MNRLSMLLLGTLLLYLPAKAQEEETEEPSYRLEYAHMHTIEFNGGWTWNMNQYNHLPSYMAGFLGDNGNGMAFKLRYTHFVKPQWGLFASAEFSNIWGDMRLDNGLYNYQKLYPWPHSSTQEDDILNPYTELLVGGTYRWDFGNRWSLRTHLGVGYRLKKFSNYYYARWDNRQTNPLAEMMFQIRPDQFEEVQVQACDLKHRVVDMRGSFSIAPSIQLCYTPNHHMFFSAEVQWSGTMRHFYERINVYNVQQTVTSKPLSKDDYLETHENYSSSRDCSYIFDYRGDKLYKIDYQRTLLTSTDHRVTLGNFLSVRLGIGWNIGRNQNRLRR